MPLTEPAPAHCATCSAVTKTPAEAFLHAYVHSSWQDSRDFTIARLPYSLYPAVAQGMQAYAEAQRQEPPHE